MTAAPPPLCVDLDGTLCRSDTLLESFLCLLKAHPLLLLALPFWLLRGRAHLKQQIASRVMPRIETLPWNGEVADWLRAEHAAGRRLVLCTGADRRIAEAVAAHWGLFDAVLGSDGETNLTARRKRDALVQRYGAQGYDYIGNSSADLPVWSACRRAVVVGTDRLAAGAAAVAEVERRFAPGDAAGWKTWLRALRLHQWAKNALVLLPMVLAGAYTGTVLGQSLLAFLAFGICASGVYLLNDLLDLEADRHHPRKRHRPFAAGQLSLLHGLLLSGLLLVLSLGLALAVQLPFLLTLAGYYVLTLSYSLVLKTYSVIDVLALASLYTLRLLGGAAATGLALSFWLLAFSMFLFLSLGVVKRYAEIHDALAGGRHLKGRGYRRADLPLLQNFGVSAGYGAVLVLALYINSPDSLLSFAHPARLWLLCPLLLFWISRVWVRTHRGQMDEDPVVFALRDGVSRAVLLLVAALFVAASLP